MQVTARDVLAVIGKEGLPHSVFLLCITEALSQDHVGEKTSDNDKANFVKTQGLRWRVSSGSRSGHVLLRVEIDMAEARATVCLEKCWSDDMSNCKQV